MSESKFTPGPWCVGKFNTMLVVNHLGWKITSGYMVVDLNESQANARLIAAAPDMYEALKALVDGIDQYDGFVALGDMVTARAAIAKAEGEDA